MNKLTHPGNLIIAGLAGMILFMVYMVTQCLRQNIPLVNENYYQKEVAYQQEIDAKENASSLLEKISITKVEKTLQVNIPNAVMENFTSGEIKFYCPSDKSQDKEIKLQKQTGPIMVNTADWKNIGYIAKVNIEAGGKKYYQEVDIKL
jgi:hypothetical protein